MSKVKENLKKIPYVIIIGTSAILVFYMTLTLIVTYIIFNGVAAATGDSVTIFDTWWQTLLFVLDLVFGIALILSIVGKIVLRDREKPKTGIRQKLLNGTAWSFVSGFMVILLLILFIGGDIAITQYSASINGALGIDIYPKVTDPALFDGEADREYFKSKFVKKDENGNEIFAENETGIKRPVYDDDALLAEAGLIAEQVASEGSVVLMNKSTDGVPALPLDAGSKVSIFGRAGLEWSHIGQGSGQKGFNPSKSLHRAFEDCGLSLNVKLDAEYRQIKSKNPNNYTWDSCSGPPSFDSVTEHNADSVKQYGDAAIMVVSRNSGEGWDPYWWFDLNTEEKAYLTKLLDYRKNGVVKKVILLINSSNAISFKSVKDYDLDACVWVGMGGDKTYEQVANVLSGKIAPSGRLPDTFVYDIEKSEPAYPRGSDLADNNHNGGGYTYSDYNESAVGLPGYTQAGTFNNKYLIYQEGIYVGYRYYETRYADAVTNDGNNANNTAGSSKSGEGWSYANEVAYPFGHGLSYTTFAYSDYTVTENADGKNYDITVNVKNTGARDGKEVVQVYLQKPYTDYDKNPEHPVEKAAVELVGFTKVSVPKGETVSATVSVPKSSFKSYDAYGAGTYIVEKGKYYLATGFNSHDALNNILAKRGFTTENGMDADGNSALAHEIELTDDDFTTYAVSEYTGAAITNRFDDVDINRYDGRDGQSVTYMTRNDWSTFPTNKAKLSIKGEKMIADMQYGKYVEPVEGDEMPVFGQVTADAKLQLSDMIGASYDDPRWTDLMNQLTWEDHMQLLTYSFRMIAGAPNADIPGGKALDGPAGVAWTCYPCEVLMAATFDTELIERLGTMFGTEAMHANVVGIYAPGANIHRSASGGRNWEYFSEDGFLSGAILVSELKGLQSAGVIVFTKHFVLNDQEKNRAGVCVWANEQTIREIYLKPFEMGVTQAQMNGVMSSFNRLGCTWSGRHKGLLTDVLRGEWNFKGVNQTDCVSDGYEHMINEHAMAEGLLAGQDMWMSYGYKAVLDNYKDNPTVAKALREAVKKLVFAQANSFAMNGLGVGVYVIEITPWWETLINVCKWVCLALTLACVGVTVTCFALPAAEKAKLKKSAALAEGGSAETSAKTVKAKSEKPKRKKLTVREKNRIIRYLTAGSLTGIAALMIAVTILLSVTLSAVLKGSGNGNGNNTVTPPDVTPPPTDNVTCNALCPVCGLCLDENCTEHENKCGGDRKNKTLLQAENAANVDEKYVSTDFTDDWLEVQSDLTLEFDSDIEGAVTLILRISRGEKECKLKDCYYTELNGAACEFDVTVPAAGESGEKFALVNLGCIEVVNGKNTLYFMHYDSEPVFDIDYAEIKYSNGDITEKTHVCTHVCPVCGGCKDDTCTDPVCSDKCGVNSSYTVYKAKDYAAFGGGCAVNADGVVGGLSNSSGRTITYNIASDKDKAVSLTAALTKNTNYASVQPFTEFMKITVNGEPYSTRAIIPLNDTTDWANSFEIPLGCIRLKSGNNTIVFTTTGKEGRNFDYIKLGEGKGSKKVLASDVAKVEKGENDWMPAINKDHPNILESINRNKGASFSFNFKIADDCEKQFYVALTKRKDANAERRFSEFMSVSLNGVEFETNAVMRKNGDDWWNTEELCLGVVKLRKGRNIIKFTVASAEDIGRNFEYIRFGDDVKNKYVSTDAMFGAADNGNMPNTNENPNIIGGVNGNKGATISFDVISSENREKFFYLGITKRNNSYNLSEYLKITVNGKEYATNAKMRNCGSDAWFDAEDLFLGSVKLEKGLNRIILTVVSDNNTIGRNLGYIRFA